MFPKLLAGLRIELPVTGGYRADIGGLRALAVLSVIIFHVNRQVLPGGFVGVDIFFVISGYLITRHILQELKAGKFSLVSFYKRRIKRIVPASLLVISVTLVMSWLLLLPDDVRGVAKSGLFAVVSMSNIYFWLYQDTGYFAQSSDQLPLLHLWSLGVEEQFYIILPMALIVCHRWLERYFSTFVILLIALTSFELGSFLFARSPQFVYYMLPARAGELLMGALPAILIEKSLRPPAFSSFSLLGFALLLFSLFGLSDHDVFPGWPALLPSLGTSLMIYSGHYHRDSLTFKILKNGYLGRIGLLSYSLYLWHWPVLALYRYGYGEPEILMSLMLMMVVFFLAWLTYLFVEEPCRHSSASFRKILLVQFFAPSFFVALLSLIMIYGHGFQHTAYDRKLDQMKNASKPSYQYPYVCQRQKLTLDDTHDPRCVLGPDAALPVTHLLIGDSNAAQYVGMLGVVAQHDRFRFRNIEVGSCPLFLEGDVSSFVSPKRIRDCEASQALVSSLVDEAKVVIFAVSWTEYDHQSSLFLPQVSQRVQSLVKRGKQVILIGKAPELMGYDRLCREKALSFPWVHCSEGPFPLTRQVRSINQRLKALAKQFPGVSYFDANTLLCPDGQCYAYDKQGSAWYYDADHLNMSASWKLGYQLQELSHHELNLFRVRDDKSQ